MAKQIIILDVSKGPGGDRNVRYLFWLYPASGREVPAPGMTSAFRNASGAENTALQAGTVVEESRSKQFPTGYSQSQIKAILEAEYVARSAEFAAQFNPNQFYGVTWDGSIWA